MADENTTGQGNQPEAATIVVRATKMVAKS